jgi:cyclic pyranopterin phosphate synthase
MAERRRLTLIDSRVARYASVPRMPADFESGGPVHIEDGFCRTTTNLRLSLTDRCNFACVYCMPPEGEREHASRAALLSFEEAVRVIRAFADCGVRRVRFTGGEPLVRKDVVRLVEMARRTTPVDELVMTTNGSRLAELARPLAAAGLRGVNVSIDSLDVERFAELTRGGRLGPVLAGVHAALDAGLEVKINCVALADGAHDEVGAIVDWAWELGVTPRFIELMPLGEGSKLPAGSFLSAQAIRQRLGSRLSETSAPDAGKGPARYALAADGSGRRVGFISALSAEFCDSCNRARVTAQGDLRACLADRRAVSLRDVIRSGASDAELRWAIHWALRTKASGHGFNDPAVREHQSVGMSLIGG